MCFYFTSKKPKTGKKNGKHTHKTDKKHTLRSCRLDRNRRDFKDRKGWRTLLYLCTGILQLYTKRIVSTVCAFHLILQISFRSADRCQDAFLMRVGICSICSLRLFVFFKALLHKTLIINHVYMGFVGPVSSDIFLKTDTDAVCQSSSNIRVLVYHTYRYHTGLFVDGTSNILLYRL